MALGCPNNLETPICAMTMPSLSSLKSWRAGVAENPPHPPGAGDYEVTLRFDDQESVREWIAWILANGPPVSQVDGQM
jgi:hypothetical protein